MRQLVLFGVTGLQGAVGKGCRLTQQVVLISKWRVLLRAVGLLRVVGRQSWCGRCVVTPAHGCCVPVGRQRAHTTYPDGIPNQRQAACCCSSSAALRLGQMGSPRSTRRPGRTRPPRPAPWPGPACCAASSRLQEGKCDGGSREGGSMLLFLQHPLCRGAGGRQRAPPRVPAPLA